MQLMIDRINQCRFFQLPQITDARGDLTFIENSVHIPFDIKRVYFLSKIPYNAERGGHAHKALHQIIIPISGSFTIHIDDGFNKKSIHLDRDDQGFYICPFIWREIDSFSEGAVCLVLASDFYSEEDYFRDYHAFINFVQDEK